MNTPSERIQTLLARLYPPELAQPTYHRIVHELAANAVVPPQPTDDDFSAHNVTLITYADRLCSTALDGSERMLYVFNLTVESQGIAVETTPARELLTGEASSGRVALAPYQVRWLQRRT